MDNKQQEMCGPKIERKDRMEEKNSNRCHKEAETKKAKE